MGPSQRCPRFLHEWHSITEDTLVSVCIVAQH